MTSRLRIFDTIAEAHDAIAALGNHALFVYRPPSVCIWGCEKRVLPSMR